MLRVVDGNDVGMLPGKDLAAGRADAAGKLTASGTLHGGGHAPRQRVLSGAIRPAEQIAVRDSAAVKGGAQTRLQRFVSVQPVQPHPSRLPCVRSERLCAAAFAGFYQSFPNLLVYQIFRVTATPFFIPAGEKSCKYGKGAGSFRLPAPVYTLCGFVLTER